MTLPLRPDAGSRKLEIGLRKVHAPEKWSPELLRRQPRAFRHRGELGKHHLRIDRGLSDPGAVAAIRSGNDVLAPDQLGVAADALRDQLRMLDEIRFGFEHAGDQYLALRQFHRFE